MKDGNLICAGNAFQKHLQRIFFSVNYGFEKAARNSFVLVSRE